MPTFAAMKIVRKSIASKSSTHSKSVHEYRGCDYIHIPDAQHISPIEFEALKTENEILLLDVREQYEFENKNIGGLHVPLSMLYTFSEDLPNDKTIVVHCKSGKRSLVAIQILEELGFDNVLNLEGGINAYLEEFKP